MTSFKEEKTLVLLFFFALALRLIMVKWIYVMANDGVVYISMARDLFSGDYSVLMRHSSHPLYPLLIGAVQKVIFNWELAGKIVSVITGSLIVIPFYIWGRKNFGEKAALYSTLFLAVNPYHVRYSADVITESTYILFFFLAVIFSADAVFRKKYLLYFYSGLFTGLAYLTRPEGIILLFPLIAWTLFAKFPTIRLKSAALIIFVLTVFIVALPYALYLRSNYGRWLVTGKYETHKITGIKGSARDFNQTEKGKGSATNEAETATHLSKSLYKGLMSNLVHLGYLGDKFAVTYHPLMTLLLLYGIFRRKIPWSENRANYYLLTIIGLFMVILFRLHMVYEWFGRRHVLPFTVLATYWAGISFAGFIEGLQRRISERKGEPIVCSRRIAIVCMIIALAIILPKTLKPRRLDKLPEKRVGLWLKENSIKSPVIITNMSRVSFYAEGIDHYLPPGGYDELISYAQKNDVDYIIVNEYVKGKYPDFQVKARNSGFRLVLKEGGEKEEKISVYRVK